uniref:Pentacotripeptide-repeat region of PRORP domain-containing protein n=2 Tax=Brassica campestris TaxID=3711 RepID=M4D402_BRACM
MRFPVHMALRRQFFSTSVKSATCERLLSALSEFYRQKNINLSPKPSHKISPHVKPVTIPISLRSIFSEFRWQNNPSLVSFLQYATSVDVSSLSSLSLNPNFKDTVSCHAAVLHVLTSHGISCHVPRIFISMTKMCRSVQESMLVADFYRRFKSQLTPKYCHALLDLLAKYDVVVEMKKVYTEILEKGMVSSRGTYTPNLMIESYCKRGYVVESRQYLCKMIQAGLAPDLVTFTSLVLGHCRRHHVEAAFHVFNEMVDHGCAQCYEKLILEICEVRNLEMAERVLDQMLKEGIVPSDSIFITLVNRCCMLQEYGEAVKIVEDMIRCGHLLPFEYCKTLVYRLYDVGDKRRAGSLIKKLLCSGFYHDELACENWLNIGQSGSLLHLLFYELQPSSALFL